MTNKTQQTKTETENEKRKESIENIIVSKTQKAQLAEKTDKIQPEPEIENRKQTYL